MQPTVTRSAKTSASMRHLYVTADLGCGSLTLHAFRSLTIPDAPWRVVGATGAERAYYPGTTSEDAVHAMLVGLLHDRLEAAREVEPIDA
jgi:hypothetical protein